MNKTIQERRNMIFSKKNKKNFTDIQLNLIYNYLNENYPDYLSNDLSDLNCFARGWESVDAMINYCGQEMAMGDLREAGAVLTCEESDEIVVFDLI